MLLARKHLDCLPLAASMQIPVVALKVGRTEESARLAVSHSGAMAGDDATYDAARGVWNGMIDEHPALIARCEGTSDVIAALDYASTEGLPATIRGGGHSVAGRAVRDDALLIDMSLMRSVQVDPTTRTARVESGAAVSRGISPVGSPPVRTCRLQHSVPSSSGWAGSDSTAGRS